MIKNKIKNLDLIDSLIALKIILEEIYKVSIIRYLEIKEISEIIIKNLKELETEKIDELQLLQENLKSATLRNRFWGRLNSIKEEVELRKLKRKKR